MIKFTAVAAPLVAMCLLSAPAFAQDAMSGGSMMADDPMATECIEMAAAETDMMKMESMMADCAVKYPDAVAAHCMMKAEMETDAMKKYVAEVPAALVARDQLEFSVAELSTHENQRVTKALNDGLQAALTGAKEPGPALAEAQREATRILRAYKR